MLKASTNMIDASASLGVRVHISETFEPAALPELLLKDKRVIVVAFDESAESQHSLNWALKNIFDPRSDILILISITIFQEPYWFSTTFESDQDKHQHKTQYADAYSSKLSTVASSILEEHQFKEQVKVQLLYLIIRSIMIYLFSAQAMHGLQLLTFVRC